MYLGSPLQVHLAMLLLHSMLLLLLHCQPLLLHVLLHGRADRAAVALALLVVLQQLSGRHTPVTVRAWGQHRGVNHMTHGVVQHNTGACRLQAWCGTSQV